MSTLIAIAYDSELKAREVRLRFAQMQQDYQSSLSHEDEARLQAAIATSKSSQ